MNAAVLGKDPGNSRPERLPGHRASVGQSPISVNEGPGHPFFPYLLPMTTLHDPEPFLSQSPEPACRIHHPLTKNRFARLLPTPCLQTRQRPTCFLTHGLVPP